jgi:glycosidase
MMEFHISRTARDQYQFDQSLFQFTGNAVIANIQGARLFAQRMNDLRDKQKFPNRYVNAGDMNAMGLIDELSHLVIKLYDEDVRKRLGSDQRMFSRALDYASQKVGAQLVYQTVQRFCDNFPPLDVYQGKTTVAAYLASHSVDALEEQLVLWLENVNPAFKPFNELFDDTSLREQSQYVRVIDVLNEYFSAQPTFGPDNQTLVELLRAPALASPDSLEGQIRFIQERWVPFFGASFGKFVTQLLVSLDLITEDKKAALSFGWVGDGNPQSFVPSADELRGGANLRGGGDIKVVEYEAFTQDKDWMPRLVMMAKNSYVWLDQLSRKYQRAITHLDQVPDEELDVLASWGITGLWLIGLWERGQASQRIKQMMGAQDAVASAYSLYDYSIAGDLGGYGAMENLKARAWQRGIRMASDMVPNHMGIDSKWVIERPDYFLSLDHPPYPSYSFNGPDLSNDGRVGIYIEDHYFSKSDAAVVFKRVDKASGDTRYIYHGNDGTSIPWNDTAQINYLNAEAREAVTQAIFHVARQFPIIRFDAAMTLAKKQVRRLWFPEPGSGGAIPSRAGHGMSAEQFEALMPHEFWREVVDRAAIEIPDTLLLAEAFWMLEGYFVRTLGMHRVYNSAFMNMLRDEKNDEYRQLIKNTIEFDPEILRRYVNFLNNPDEKTAVEQFGKGDKYFGVTLMMLTMPGLPMFGHGQVEGYSEKYGMEFRYPKLWEWPDADLVARHEREIFPIVKKRYLYAGVDAFRLFDFWAEGGGVDENVFAYSNRFGDERALVLYHNRFATVRGWIKSSAAYVVKHGEDKVLSQSTLGEALGLTNDGNTFAIFKDQLSGLEFIHSSKQLCEDGLFVHLEAYKAMAFTEIREVVSDAEHPYAEIHARLGGRGVQSVVREMELLKIAPVIEAFRGLVNGDRLKQCVLAEHRDDKKKRKALLNGIEADATKLMAEIKRHLGSSANDVRVAKAIANDVTDVFDLMSDDVEKRAMLPLKDDVVLATLFAWLLTRRMGDLVSFTDGEASSRKWLVDWTLGDVLRDAFRGFGMTEDESWQRMMQVKVIMGNRGVLELDDALAKRVNRETSNVKSTNLPTYKPANLQTLFADPDAKALLQVNTHEGATYFNKEQFESLVHALHVSATADDIADDAKSTADFGAQITRQRQVADALIAAGKAAGYQVEKLLSVEQTDNVNTAASEVTSK